MRRSPDDDELEEHHRSGSDAIELMQRLQGVLGTCPLETAFEALGNMMVLLAVAASSSKAEAHEVIDDEWPCVHHCLEVNFESALKLHAAMERRGATVH